MNTGESWTRQSMKRDLNKLETLNRRIIETDSLITICNQRQTGIKIHVCSRFERLRLTLQTSSFKHGKKRALLDAKHYFFQHIIIFHTIFSVENTFLLEL